MKSLALLPFTLLSLNLHGYHPMGEAPRFLESRDGKVQQTDSHLFYFTREELQRGHERRLNTLARDLGSLSADVVLLQEVAAGSPDSARDCHAFKDRLRGDRWDANSALRLSNRMHSSSGEPNYQVLLGCRGNTGWTTQEKQFRDSRVIRLNSNGKPEVVFDYGANPYPQGMMVEGTAILVKKGWKVLDHQEWNLQINSSGWSFFVQAAALSPPSQNQTREPGWILVVNLHAAWDPLQHFEQAVAVRRRVAEYLASATHAGPFQGVVFGGDFNQTLLRPSFNQGNPSTLPWEIHVPGQFDFRGDSSSAWRDSLAQTLGNKVETAERACAAVQGFIDLQSQWQSTLAGQTHSLFLKEALEQAQTLNRCTPNSSLPASCQHAKRIDLLFMEPEWEVQNAFITYPANNWISLEGTSDHPGIFAQIMAH